MPPKQLQIPIPILQNIYLNLTDSDKFLGSLLTRLLLFAIILAGFYFLARLVSAGYRFLVSTGDPAQLQGATQEIITASTGLLIIISAYFLAQIIQSILGIKIV